MLGSSFYWRWQSRIPFLVHSASLLGPDQRSSLKVVIWLWPSTHESVSRGSTIIIICAIKVGILKHLQRQIAFPSTKETRKSGPRRDLFGQFSMTFSFTCYSCGDKNKEAKKNTQVHRGRVYCDAKGRQSATRKWVPVGRIFIMHALHFVTPSLWP